MKKRNLILATVLLTFVFTSCLDLGDDDEYVQDWMCMVTVTTGGANPVFLMDEGTYLTSETSLPADTFTVGERYYLHFIMGDTINHPVNTYPVKIDQYGKTAIKDFVVLPKDSTDKWEDQPVMDLYAWCSGHYFNTFFVSYAGMTTPNTIELVRMKKKETATSTDTVPTLYFELRHNVKTFSTGAAFYRFYSFDLTSLKTEFPQAKRFALQISSNLVSFGEQSFLRTYTPDAAKTGAELLAWGKNNPRPSLTPF